MVTIASTRISTSLASWLLGSVLWVMTVALGAVAQPALVATFDRPATIDIAAPASGARSIYLDLRINSYVPPRTGEMEIQVTLRSAQASREFEIGRFAMFPAVAFQAAENEQRAYRFEAAGAVGAIGVARQLIVMVRIVASDPANPPAGAQLGVARAAWVTAR